MNEYIRDTVEGIRVLGFWRCFYAQFVYRHHMRFIHRFGFCHMKQFPISRNPKFSEHRCHWCGMHGERLLPTDGPLRATP